MCRLTAWRWATPPRSSSKVYLSRLHSRKPPDRRSPWHCRLGLRRGTVANPELVPGRACDRDRQAAHRRVIEEIREVEECSGRAERGEGQHEAECRIPDVLAIGPAFCF